jgi:transcriptional regulator
MYQPPAFRLDDVAACHALMRAHPLGALVTAGPDGIEANHVPFVLYPDEGALGVLRCHIARPNGQGRSIGEGAEALVIFMAADGYVSPSLYPSKAEHGKVVPTWNYVVVHARGRARLVEDDAWLAAQIEALTVQQEGGRERPWAVSDAPAPFIAAQRRGIVGVEIEIASLEGKAKVSQNRPAGDKASVHAAFAASDAPGDRLMAGMLGEKL